MWSKLISITEQECKVFSLFNHIRVDDIGLAPDNENLAWLIYLYDLDNDIVFELVEKLNSAADDFFSTPKYTTKRFFYIYGLRIERVFTGISIIHAFSGNQWSRFLELMKKNNNI